MIFHFSILQGQRHQAVHRFTDVQHSWCIFLLLFIDDFGGGGGDDLGLERARGCHDFGNA